MTRTILFAVLFLLTSGAYAQVTDSVRRQKTSTILYAGAGPQLAFGLLQESHAVGAQVEAGGYTQFARKNIAVRRLPLLFNWSIAGNYYSGRKVEVAGHPYTYKSYWLVHAYAGAALPFGKSWMGSVQVGPGIGNYMGQADFNAGVQATLNYAVGNHIIVYASVNGMKEPGTNWLGAAGVGVRWRK